MVTSAGNAGHAAHKTMQIQVQVDQTEALRQGINAPYSTVKIEVDPAQLSPEVREEIASNLLEGFRLGPSFAVVEPSLAGLLAMIERRLKIMAEKKAKEEELKKHRIAFSNAVVADPEKYVKVGGTPGTYQWGCRLIGAPWFVSDSDGEIKTTDLIFPIGEPKEISKEAAMAATAAYQRALAVHEAAHAELEKGRVAQEAAKKAKSEAERLALRNALSGDDRERFDAGYMGGDEAEKIIAGAYRASLGLELTGSAKQWGVDDFDETKILSVSAFSALKAFKQKLPEGSTCKVFEGEAEAVRKIVAEAAFLHPTIPGVEIVADCLLEEVDIEASE